MTTPPNGLNDIPENVAKAFENINSVISDYIAAVTKSNTVLWQGVEEIMRSVGGLSQESFARVVSAYNTLASAKTPQDVIGTQTDFVRDSIDNAVAGGNKVSELSIRVAKETIAPLTQHANETINAAMSKIKK